MLILYTELKENLNIQDHRCFKVLEKKKKYTKKL